MTTTPTTTKNKTKAEEEALAIKTAALSELYERAREHIRAKHGMETTEQALEAMLKEAIEEARKGLDELIATETNDHNRKVLEEWKKLPPEQIANEMDIAIADYLKKVQKTDPDFTLFKLENHKDNPAEFEDLLRELKKKGLMD
jgi:hypothetical protein